MRPYAGLSRGGIPLSRFRYLQPESLEEAVAAAVEGESGVRYIAGGTDVMVEMRDACEESEATLISLKKIPELSRVEVRGDCLHIGAAVPIWIVEKTLRGIERLDALNDGVGQIGSPQIRNVATLGGNICSSLPSADSFGPLFVLDASVSVYGPEGEREIPIEEFPRGPGKNVLRDREIVREIKIPLPPATGGSAYIKHGRRKAMEIALIGASAFVEYDADTMLCRTIRVALTTAAPVAIRAKRVEALLAGKTLDSESIAAAAKAAAEDAAPRDSYRCTARYRLDVLPVLVERALEKAVRRGC